MIGYATVGTNDLEKARGFYDALTAIIGAKRVMQLDDGFTGYGKDISKAMLCVTPPFNGEPASPGNGMMVALQADSRADVDALHAKALELGASDEGAPGIREPAAMGFYAAYFRDLDGNKLCAFNVGATE